MLLVLRCKRQRISDDDCGPVRSEDQSLSYHVYFEQSGGDQITWDGFLSIRTGSQRNTEFRIYSQSRSSQSQPRRMTVWRLLFWFEVVTGRPISTQSGWSRAGVTVREEERRQMWRGGGCRQQLTSCHYPDHTFAAPFPPFLHANSVLKPANFLLFWLQNITGTEVSTVHTSCPPKFRD